jgi:TRAP-type C4-dicarboxylate transport system permease small subunit
MAIPMSFLYGIIFLGFVMNALAVVVDIYEEFADVKEDL